MEVKIKNSIKRVFSYRIWNILLSYYQYYKFLFFKTYSCRGSIDIELIEILKKKKNGFFLEVGAYNGISESVSLRLEKQLEWRGLLIEPNLIHFKYLKRNRPKNICINSICLSKDFLNKKLFLKNLNQMSYIVDDSDNSFFSHYPKDKINNLAKETLSGNFEKVSCKVDTLQNIFEDHKIKKIDLAIIDVEGSEIELLKGIDFHEVDIEYFCIETYNFKDLNTFMTKKDYTLIKRVHKEDYVYKKNSR